MPLNLSPTQIAFNARGDTHSGTSGKFNQPFADQVAFFRGKINIPTERWDDIINSAHDRAFMVAGAAKADLLDDFRKAVDKSIAEGKSIQWFRKEFNGIVQKHGWEGWTGSDTQVGRDWRTRMIYTTNMRASYAAGRYAQLTDPDLLKSRPYWKYIHNETVAHPRPLHQSWNGLVLKYDDPFWQTHYPPNGFGCRCRVTAVRPDQYKGHPAPEDGTYTKIDRVGNEHVMPQGVDYGWGYEPGQANAALLRQVIDKQEGAEWRLARANTRYLVASEVFSRFFNGQLEGEFPLAVLDDQEMSLLGSESRNVLLSRQSVDAHVAKHPEITVDDYRKAQDIIDRGEVYLAGDSRLIYLLDDGVWYRAALKRTADNQKNYFLTLFKNERGKPPGGAVKIER
jgi:hypothetical protein